MERTVGAKATNIAQVEIHISEIANDVEDADGERKEQLLRVQEKHRATLQEARDAETVAAALQPRIKVMRGRVATAGAEINLLKSQLRASGLDTDDIAKL
eukprot:gene3647-2319_t